MTTNRTFLIIDSIGGACYTAGDRVVLGPQEGIWVPTLGVLVIVRKDFDPVSPGRVRDTDSYQVRPKAIHKTNDGRYWYKGVEGREFLDAREVEAAVSQLTGDLP